MSEAIISAIDDQMAVDDSVYLLGQDVGVFGGPMQSTKGLWERYGEAGRIIDAPISEAAMVGTGVGAALAGARPVIDLMFAEFLLLTLTQLGMEAASMSFRSVGRVSVPLVVRAKFGTGPHRGHAESCIGALMGFPGLKVAVPSTPQDGYALMTASIRDQNPVVFLEHMSLLHGQRAEVDTSVAVPLGSAVVRKRGSQATVVSYGLMVSRAMRAAQSLARDGVEVEVIDLRTVAPLDLQTVAASVARTGRMVLVEESWPVAGPAAQVCAGLVQEFGDTVRFAVEFVAPPHVPIPFGVELEKQFIPSVVDIEQGVRRVLAHRLPQPQHPELATTWEGQP